MKPPPFEYHAPKSLEQALSLLAEYGDEAKPLAGGQSLVPAMSFRLARPAVLIDLGRLTGLDGIRSGEAGPHGGELRVGAMCRQRALERSGEVARSVPLLAGTLPHIAHPQIRSRGTVGGSLAHADPAAELPAVLTALGGRCRLASSQGERWVDSADFFTGLFETAVQDHELLLEVAFPVQRRGEGWGFHEFARRHGDYALVGVAAVVRTDGAAIEHASISLLSVGDGPVRIKAPGLAGLRLDESRTEEDRLREAIAEAADAIAHGQIDPPGDLQATPEYRRHLAGVLIRRALADAAGRARENR